MPNDKRPGDAARSAADPAPPSTRDGEPTTEPTGQGEGAGAGELPGRWDASHAPTEPFGASVRPEQATQSTLAEAEGTSPPLVGDLAKCFPIPGYTIEVELGRGGMGVVLAGRDLTLDRDVAIKVMRVGGDSAAASARFVRESKIAARLAHPSIPPVHALGAMQDGSPFLVMKRIHGETLSRLFGTRQTLKEGLTRLLHIFEQIAQAVGFAHAQGIIHRDLKPANVMVGEFGEVQVMDWGLAKTLTDEQSSVGPISGGAVSLAPYPEPRFPNPDSRTPHPIVGTLAGSIMGTPGYMAPEQARGEEVDARADVFSLGAILCELLTGSTPLGGTGSARETIQRVAEGDLSAAWERLARSGADAELINLTRACLAPRADDRPADAKQVAEAVSSYRAAVERRLQEVAAEQAASEARIAEQRKRRRVVMVAAGIVGALLTTGICVSTWLAFKAWGAERDTQEQLAQTKEARSQAEQARDQARVRYQLALDAFDDMVFAIQTKLGKHSGTLELRKELLLDARGGLTRLLAEAGRQGNPDQKIVWSHFQLGKIERSLGDVEGAQREFDAGYQLASGLVEADPQNEQHQRDLCVALTHLSDLALQMRQPTEALEYIDRKLAIVRRLAPLTERPDILRRDLSEGLGQRGRVLLQLGRVDEAEQACREKRQVAQGLVDDHADDAQHRRDLSVAYELLGDVAGFQQRVDESLECYLRQSEIIQQLWENDPQNIGLQRDAGIGQLKLGNIHQDTGRPQEAVEFYSRGIELLGALAQADSENIQAQLELFIAHDSLGMSLESLHRYADAATRYRQGLALIAPLQARNMLTGQFERAVPDLEARIVACERLDQAVKDLAFTLQQPASEVPALLDTRLRALLARQDREGALATAEALSQLAENEAELCYNAACAWSLCGGQAEAPDEADECVVRALSLLRRTPTGDGRLFPNRSALAAQIAADTDLDALRERAEFKALVRQLEASPASE